MKSKTEITDNQITEAGHDLENAGQVRALCAHLDCEPDDLSRESYDHYGLALYALGSKSYAIGTDSEADEAAQKNIEDSAWAFNASFLSGFCDIPEEVFVAMQGKCEGANDAFLSLINKSGGIEKFAQEAISADGRGHFMSSYDGEENEEGDFYIYRTN
jgi:hypothetical protein